MVKRRTLITVLLVLGIVLSAAAHEVGWILMLPLVKHINGTARILKDAPLSEWRPHKAYDTASECESDRVQEVVEADNTMIRLGKAGVKDAVEQSLLLEFSTARCVPASAVYPQVKEK